MKITAIKREKGHLSRLTFENGESLLIDSDLCAEKCLHEGDTLSPEDKKRLLTESDYLRAKARAIRLLDRYTYTESRLLRKLKETGFPEEAAKRAVERLKELGLINDREFALTAAEDLSRRGVSKRAAYAKLLSKGISAKTAKEATEAVAFDEGGQLKELIERRYKNKLAAGETQKVFAALIRKGFSYGAVREALKKYSEEIEYSEDI